VAQQPTEIVAELLGDTERCLADLVRYVERYTGSYFDATGRRASERWVDPSPDRFTMEDVQSTALLSVPLRPTTTLALLEQNDRLTALLAEIPTDVDLGAARDAVEPWTDFWVEAAQAHSILREVDWVGRTVASKLLARKRPALLPVWDTRVSGILGTPGVDNDWLLMQSLFRTHKPALASLRGELTARLPDVDRVTALSELRVLDIVLWMSGEPQVQT
jgi:hypothetical protein